MTNLNRKLSDEDAQAERDKDILNSLEGNVENLLPLFTNIEDSWQPSDLLPSHSYENEALAELRVRSANMPDDLLVVLVGDMITEEALPTYSMWLTRLFGKDPTGTSDNPFALITRKWSAEENKHGSLLNAYLRLNPRINMREVEKTIQYLISNGFDPLTTNDPVKGFIYTSFQERATNVSHMNVARQAKQYDESAYNICSTIAKDEKRHETLYKTLMQKIFEIEPERAILAFAQMMKKKIQMPAQLMSDGTQDQEGKERSLFRAFADVAQKVGVYTAQDYIDIMQNLSNAWKVHALAGLEGEAAKAQEYVLSLPDRYRKVAERVEADLAKLVTPKFSWLTYNVRSA